jgi:tight adherence protein B
MKDTELKRIVPKDYNHYVMSINEKTLYIVLSAIAIFSFSFVFYQHVIFSLLMTPLSLIYPSIRVKQIIAKRKRLLNVQFKDMLNSLSSSMSTGNSLKTSMENLVDDLKIIYPRQDTIIMLEAEYIKRNIDLQVPVQDIWTEFAKRTDIQDISSFSSVLLACMKAGGNLVEVIRTSANIINSKIEVKNQIQTMIFQKKTEQMVLNIMPFFLVIILSIVAKDYIQPIFSTIIGRIIMTIAFFITVASFFISKKIMEIDY